MLLFLKWTVGEEILKTGRTKENLECNKLEKLII